MKINSFLGVYNRTDPAVLREAESRIESGKSSEQVYFANNKQHDDPNKILSLKSVQNLKYNATKNDKLKTELNTLIDAVQENKLIKVLRFTGDRYTAICYSENMLQDIKRFCVDDDAVFAIDTTFEIVPGLWLTDTTYECRALFDINRKHPHFPGPFMLHFRKDEPEFRAFGYELISQCTYLSGIRKIGHDLEAAMAIGFATAFPKSKHLWCTQHVQERTIEKLRKMKVEDTVKNKVMMDVYGSQDVYIFNPGLADADDDDDLQLQLQHLEESWEKDIPWFGTWFRKHQLKYFQACLTMSARESLGISGRFYNNNLENHHRLQKKK